MPVYEEYVVVDAAGRLQIPPDLRADMGISERVTLERADGGILIRAAAGLQPIISPDHEVTTLAEDQPLSPGRRALDGWLKRIRRGT
jgi:hypothetical protein